MYIHNLFKHLRTTEGVIRERFQLSDHDWRIATHKYGWLKNPAHGEDKEYNAALDIDDNEPIDASYLGSQK